VAATALFVAVVAAPVAIAADTVLQTLGHGAFLLSDASEPPPATEPWQPVGLPDRWDASHPGQRGIAWYRLAWDLDAVSQSSYAVFLKATNAQTRVYVNGSYVGTTGIFDGPRPRGFDQAQAFDVPATLLARGANTVHLQVNSPTVDATGIDVVLAGPEAEVRRQALHELLVHAIAPGIVSVATVVVGVSILLLWLRRRERAYLLFGAAAVLWGLHTAVSILPAQPLPSPHYAILWNAVYMLFAVLLSLFCADFVEFRSPAYRRVAIGFAFLVVPVLYASLFFGGPPYGALGAAASITRAIGIGIVLVALAAVARYAAMRRSIESLLLLLAGAVAAGFAVHDWVLARDPQSIRPVWLVPYAAVFFLSLFGWVLVDRFVRALNAAERANAVLERRVQENSAALVRQLADTESARHQAEESQRQAEAARMLAEVADRSKSRFLAAASHDLRQPLHALGLFAAALGERTRDAQTQSIVERIRTLVTSLEALLSALLDVSKLEAGIVVATPRDFGLDALLARIANDFAPEAVDNGIELLVLPTRRFARSDPLLLERILRNLVANALKYTPRGGVLVGCRRRGADLSIEVWDTGPGIPVAEQGRIFEEFYQIGNPGRDRSKGLGLGLAIVRRLADLLGHEVSLASRLGRGSVFRVRVPQAVAQEERSETPIPPPPGALAGRRILVVDDEAAVREGMRDALAAWGCIAEACAGLADVPAGIPAPDVLVVDYRLAGGAGGITVIAELRSRFCRDVPALLVSGESSGAELARIKASGIPLLHKPVPPARLRAALLYVLRGEGVAESG
jgi:signal transduction histidine kinase/CheY-like chemotaxis protein